MSRHTTHWLIAILFVLLAHPAHAAIQGFLCVTDTGYKGESTTPGFVFCSDLGDFAHTRFIDGSMPIARDIKFDKLYDTMSNPLRTAMVNLTTLNEVKIRVVSLGNPNLEFFDLRLIGVHVNSAAMSWTDSDRPTDTIGFSAASIEIKYAPISQGGTLGQASYTCWNVAANTATNAACPP